MFSTPEQELKRALAWDRFWELAAEGHVNSKRREEMAALLQEQGHTLQDFERVDHSLCECDRALRHLRRTLKAFPELLSEAGCGAEVDRLRLQTSRLSASWREVKSSWRERDPRPPSAR